MKLAIFIPAFNEEITLGKVLDTIPRHFTGIKELKIFVIDDGSTDKTSLIAQNHGAQVVHTKGHKGLANAFKIGLETALSWGADIICHLDADGQYDSTEIGKVIEPIIQHKAEMVVGNRQIETLNFMDWPRRYGNSLGSWLVRKMLHFTIQDASSGFRAYSKQAATQLEVHSTHTYTHETLIEAKFKGITLAEVPITFSKRHDHSRLTHNLPGHILKSLGAICRAYKRYHEHKQP